MDYTVGTVWIIYIITVLIVLIIFWIALKFTQNPCNRRHYGIAFFLATVIGAIAVLIAAAWLNTATLTSSENAWLSVLLVVAFLIPILVIFYIVWAGQYSIAN